MPLTARISCCDVCGLVAFAFDLLPVAAQPGKPQQPVPEVSLDSGVFLLETEKQAVCPFFPATSGVDYSPPLSVWIRGREPAALEPQTALSRLSCGSPWLPTQSCKTVLQERE
uniref:Uncharacterized protein n=1 Tax=Sphaerodactylus townsendi TaxID=933632 RepID=A0ACB8FFM8_9SAUR